MEKDNSQSKMATFGESVVVLLIIVAFIVGAVQLKVNIVTPLLFSWLVMYFFAIYKKNSWQDVQVWGYDAVRSGLSAVMILLAVGALIGVWIVSGTVPTIIYYGLLTISPKWFLPATLILCSILSVATGTSYGSAGSAGLAMMGIGISMGFPPGLIAGAVICGSLFGDKLSPFSDTTNIAPAMAGADLFKHIACMMWTTLPVWLLSLIIFSILGTKYSVTNYDPKTVVQYITTLKAHFNLSIATMIPMVLVIVMLLLKTPALPTLLIGTVVGGVVAAVWQGTSLADIITVLHKGYNIDTGVLLVDKLLNRGGLRSMADIAMILIFAMGLGGMLEKTGVLTKLLEPIVSRIHNTAQLIITTLVVSYICGALSSTQDMSHVMTGKLMGPIYKQRGVAPEICSRTMEDAGTLGGALMPWHTNAIFFCGVLGVTYSQYIPYVFLCYLTPLLSIFYAVTGLTIKYVNNNKPQDA